MKRPTYRSLLPAVLVLLLVWLVLNDSFSAGHLLLGLLLALMVAAMLPSARPLQARVRRPLLAIRLLLRVLADVIRSNITVVGIVLGPERRRRSPGFIQVPLDLRDPHGLAVLSMIVTATPGTVWAETSPDHRVLTLHILELEDESAWQRTIKERYERPLMEIFE
ncbi:MAG: Na+/H+ antiporter subunit E [Proteobacteria bacterium]|nr:Na+/H+ antiporter subunit E [Pseudomonadota bacterium]